VFQNPDSALNRSHSIRHLIGRAIRQLGGLRGAENRDRVLELRAVLLPERYLGVRPRRYRRLTARGDRARLRR
jgi:peptide/nickel transport system ATP-binding protein